VETLSGKDFHNTLFWSDEELSPLEETDLLGKLHFRALPPPPPFWLIFYVTRFGFCRTNNGTEDTTASRLRFSIASSFEGMTKNEEKE